MRPDVDIAVVGAGIVGVATARALAGSAGSVLLLERFERGHAHGSSHGTSRIFRLSYADERFVRMAVAAGEAWSELEASSGEALIERTGCLDVGPVAAGISRALAACGVRHEELSAKEVASRWPIRLDDAETATFQPDGGFTYADRAYAVLLGEAVERGAEVRERTPVLGVSRDRGCVVLALDDGELRARSVVVCAGAWTAGLVREVGIELDVVPTRETVTYVRHPGVERLPSVIDYGGLPGPGAGGVARVGQAGFALPAPDVGLKAGLHHSGPRTDPDSAGTPDARVSEWAAEWVSSRYPDAAETLHAETCLYTNTADEAFVLERHGRVVVGSACSGHGFKFAPVVGRTLAALAREAAA